MRWRAVCEMACRLPEVEAGRSYGVPVVRVRGSFVAQRTSDGASILVKAGGRQRDEWCACRPETFTAASDGGGALMAVRLATVDPEDLWHVLVASWRLSVPASLAEAHDTTTW